MKITVVGGSQGTGAQVARAATAAGHEVRVVSRRGEAPAGTIVLKGSATDLATVRQAVRDADAVIVTVGGAKGVKLARTQITDTVVAAMRQEGTRRLIVQSSLAAGASASQLPFPMSVIAPLMLAKPLEDHNHQEQVVRDSGLDWTIVRPSGLTDKPATGTVRALQVRTPGTLTGSITRADLARFMLALVPDAGSHGTHIGVSGA